MSVIQRLREEGNSPAAHFSVFSTRLQFRVAGTFTSRSECWLWPLTSSANVAWLRRSQPSTTSIHHKTSDLSFCKILVPAKHFHNHSICYWGVWTSNVRDICTQTNSDYQCTYVTFPKLNHVVGMPDCNHIVTVSHRSPLLQRRWRSAHFFTSCTSKYTNIKC